MEEQYFKDRVDTISKFYDINILKISYSYKIKDKIRISIVYNFLEEDKTMHTFNFDYDKKKSDKTKFDKYLIGNILFNSFEERQKKRK